MDSSLHSIYSYLDQVWLQDGQQDEEEGCHEEAHELQLLQTDAVDHEYGANVSRQGYQLLLRRERVEERGGLTVMMMMLKVAAAAVQLLTFKIRAAMDSCFGVLPNPMEAVTCPENSPLA
jgi:hypothetical protein